MQEQEEAIMQVIADRLGLSVDDIERNSLLREELGLGPIELNDLLNDLVQKYKITFDPSDVDNLEKVGDIIVLVEDNLLE